METCSTDSKNENTKWTTFLLSCLVFVVVLFQCQQVAAQCDNQYQIGEEIYFNPLAGREDIEDFTIETKNEGQPEITFRDGKMQLQSGSHFLMWIPETFPDNIAVSWDFLPKNDNGLAMFWFCAHGKNGKDLFDKSLMKRTGDYPQYHSGDINAYHLAYFRRNPWDNPAINTVNLRKSYGNNLVKQGPNPIPNINSDKVINKLKEPYRVMVIKYENHIRLKINDLLIFDYIDEEPYGKGKIGFRQMAKLVAEYSNLKINKVSKTK